MRRRIPAFLRVMSLLLCLALIFQWGRSLGYYDMVGRGSEWANGKFTTAVVLVVVSSRGSVGFWYNKEVDAGIVRPPGGNWIIRSAPVAKPVSPVGTEPAAIDFLGFFYEHRFIGDATEYHKRHMVMVPYWLLVLLTAVAPLRWLWALHRRCRRETAGCCRRCGYDLRGSAHQCPECGQPIFSLS